MKKCLLMTANSSGFFHTDSPNLGVYRLQHLAKVQGYESEVFDSSLVNINKALKKVNVGDYDIIGMVVSQDELEADLDTLKHILDNKRRNKPLIIAGGLEATLNGEQWLREKVDLILTGLAEDSFYKTLNFISSFNFKDAMEKIKKLNGVMYLENGSVVFNPNRELTEDEFQKNNHNLVLDMIIPYEKYWERISKENDRLLRYKKFIVENVRLYTSSACPYKCGFCNTHEFISFSQKKNHIPFRLNAEQVYQQILYHIKKYGAKSFVFNDDEPLVDKKRIKDLCAMVIESKKEGIISKEVMFNCQARVTDFLNGKNVDYKFIKILCDMGFNSIGLGIETFSDRLKNKTSLDKRGFSSKQSLEVLQAINEEGITPHAYTIAFIPEATIDDIKNDIKISFEIFKKGIKLNVNNVLIARPGCPIYSSYPYTTKTIKSKISGRDIVVSDYFIPFDPFLADCAKKVRDLYNDEVEKFKEKWIEGKIPKEVLGVINYTAVAKLIGDKFLTKEGYDILKEVLNKSEKK